MTIIDLTYPIHEGMFKYPSDPEPQIQITPATETDETVEILDASGFGSGAGYGDTKYSSGNTLLTLRNHLGTHIDAPAHKLQKGKTIDQYNLTQFINPATLIDLTNTDLLERDKREITEKDIKSSLYALHPNTTAIVLYTGFCDEIKVKARENLTPQQKLEFEKTFPYISQNAADFILSKTKKLNLGLRLMGIDSFSFDPSGSNSEVHRAFFKNNTLLLETLVNLDKLKSGLNCSPFLLYSTPLNYQGADAAQTRAYAQV
ncbi:cyclase family protein [archaeon]|nr:cyclase family protein [archaeon]MBT4241940.1 cyclase family protein [archaeon]MBT4418487.1 cyclase family protein [archaeon]